MIINKVFNYSINQPNNIALLNPLCDTRSITYSELYKRAFSLALFIRENTTNNNPIVVFGHKNPYMIVCFIACILSGHAYCPVDTSMPKDRVEMILEQTNSEIVLATCDFFSSKTKIIELEEIIAICNDIQQIQSIQIPNSCVNHNGTFYIIFTSGSTGTPKGVEITADDLDNFLEWSSTLGEENKYDEKTVFLNQAPFSFDLSVMDLYTSLYCGGTLCMMEKSLQKEFSSLTPFIKENRINAIVATPSFANMCLLDRNFNSTNIPTISTFFFCGEVLTNKTAKKICERFPNAVVQNTYGPTESTVAVSNIRLTPEIIQKFFVLPVGKAKPGTAFVISDNEKRIEDNHEIGEVLILGNTLAKGYYQRKDLTEKAFIDYRLGDKTVKAYRTGDLGYLEDGQLFYCGRIDLQIKLNGFRIELGDIESCILRKKYIENCAVVPRMSNGKVKGLVAVLVLLSGTSFENIEQDLKTHLSDSLPNYMVPQTFETIEKMPMTNNGKIDRKKLSKIIEGN